GRGRAVAQRHGGGVAGVDLDVRADAAQLRLLSGQRAATLAASDRLGAAAHLCVRGDAGAAHGARDPHRPDARGVRAQRALFCRRRVCVSAAAQERASRRLAAADRRVAAVRLALVVREVPSSLIIPALLRRKRNNAPQIIIYGVVAGGEPAEEIDYMSDSRQYAAVRQKPLRAGKMAIGDFGGAPVAAGVSGPMYAAPAYWLYEMSQAALNPSRAFADAA